MHPLPALESRWLLPEGIEEMLPEQAEHLERLRRDVLDLFHCWGYELVLPPLIEYLESLLVGTAHDLDLQTFKLIDQLTGRLMGVRADMTPQVARIDAHQLKRESPSRLCYMGAVLRTQPEGFARSRSPLQVGAELYGHAGIESDVEVIHLMVETLAVTGVNNVHIDLGHVGIFRSLAQQAGLDSDQEDRLFDTLQRKARPEMLELLSKLGLDSRARTWMEALVDLNGGPEILPVARATLYDAGATVHAALDTLERVAATLSRRLCGTPLYFDLAELRGYRYQTGIVYAAFVPGHGQEVARGGRYDDIGRAFGRARPATGFSTDFNTLIAVSTALPQQTRAILAPEQSGDRALHDKVRALRAQGERVVYDLPGAAGQPHEMGCTRMLVKRADQWVIEELLPPSSPRLG